MSKIIYKTTDSLGREVYIFEDGTIAIKVSEKDLDAINESGITKVRIEDGDEISFSLD